MTGPEIWEQTAGEVDAVTFSTGTGGTLAGGCGHAHVYCVGVVGVVMSVHTRVAGGLTSWNCYVALCIIVQPLTTTNSQCWLWI